MSPGSARCAVSLSGDSTTAPVDDGDTSVDLPGLG